MSDEYHNSLALPMPKPPTTIKVLVGNNTNFATFTLPRNTLCFYSPWMRRMIATTPLLKTIVIRTHEPAAFEILVAWMNYETDSLASYHQRGTELVAWIAEQDDEGVHLAWKVWALANFLGGAFVTLRDECTTFLYHEFMGSEASPITPGIAMYVLPQKDVDDLRYFVLTCLARDGVLRGIGFGVCKWATVLQRLPGLVNFMWKGCTEPRVLGYGAAKSLDWYLSAAGNVTPDGVKQKTRLTILDI